MHTDVSLTRSPIHTGRETTHTHTRVRGRLFSAFHCNIDSNVMKLHSEIEFKLLQNNINDNFFSQAILKVWCHALYLSDK